MRGRSLSLAEAMTAYDVSKRTIYNWIREGKLQTIRTLGGSQRVTDDSAQAWLLDPRRHMRSTRRHTRSLPAPAVRTDVDEPIVPRREPSSSSERAY